MQSDDAQPHGGVSPVGVDVHAGRRARPRGGRPFDDGNAAYLDHFRARHLGGARGGPRHGDGRLDGPSRLDRRDGLLDVVDGASGRRQEPDGHRVSGRLRTPVGDLELGGEVGVTAAVLPPGVQAGHLDPVLARTVDRGGQGQRRRRTRGCDGRFDGRRRAAVLHEVRRAQRHGADRGPGAASPRRVIALGCTLGTARGQQQNTGEGSGDGARGGRHPPSSPGTAPTVCGGTHTSGHRGVTDHSGPAEHGVTVPA